MIRRSGFRIPAYLRAVATDRYAVDYFLTLPQAPLLEGGPLVSAPSLAATIVADDDEDIRQLVVIAATRAGVEVRAAVDNGNDAWEAVRHGGIDLAILDVSMPGMSGLEVADRIRADPALASTRVLIVSASVQMLSDSGFEESRIRSADRFILKPFSPKKLSATISEMLASGRIPGDAEGRAAARASG